MKKTLALLLAVLMVGALVCACGGGDTQGTTTETTETTGTTETTETTETAAPEENAEPTVYRMLYSVENTTLNYLTSGQQIEHAVACNIVDGLVEFDNHANVVPGLAESWETSEDGLTWTFHLRKGVMWYDYQGNEIAEVTANDWVAALLYVATAENNSGTFDQVKIVKGAQEWYAGELTDPAEVGVKAIDDYTLEYTLTRATPYFIGGLAYVCWLPAYAPLLEETGLEFGTSIDKIYSCGSYILTEWEPQVKQTFVKNENNWDADRVYIDRIEKTYNAEADTLAPTMALRDEVDFAEIGNDILDEWKTSHLDYLSKSRDSSGWHYWYSFDFRPTYGEEYNPLDWMKAVLNTNFRHSIMSGLDRLFVVQSVVDQENPESLIQYTVTPAGSCFTEDGTDFVDMPAFEGIEDNFFNKDKALEYKAAAIEELTAAGVTFPITIVMAYQSGNQDYENECIVVKQQLEGLLGTDYINVELWAGPSENFLSETRRAGKYSVMRVNWGADYIDPQTWTDPFCGDIDPETGLMEGNSYNRMNPYCDDAAFDYMFSQIDTNELASHVDEIKSWDGYKEFQALVIKYQDLVTAGKAEGIDITKRFETFAEAEALLINNAVIIPCYKGAAHYQVTKLNIFEGPHAACGYSGLMYKGIHLQDHFISMEEYEANFASWNAGEY